MPTYPDAPPLLTDSEWKNDAAVTAQTWRKIARWQNYAYKKHLFHFPTDLIVSGVKPGTNNRTRGAHTHDTSGTPDTTRVKVGTFYVPPSRTFATRLRVYAYTVRYSTLGVFAFDFVQQTNGRTTSVTVDNSMVGGASGWCNFTVGVTPGYVDLYIRYVSGTWAQVLGMSAWWEQLQGLRMDAIIDSTWQHLNWVQAVNDAPLHSALARWLIRKANQFSSEHPVPVFSFWCGPSADWVSQTHTLGNYQQEQSNVDGSWNQPSASGRIMARYKILVSPYVNTLVVKVGVVCTGNLNAGVIVRLDGTQLYSFTPSAIDQCQFGQAGTSVFSTASSVREVTVESTGTFPSNSVMLYSVAIWEQDDPTQAQLTNSELPIPTSFLPIADEAIAGRYPIVATVDRYGRRSGIQPMMQNMLWLWGHRGTRFLVNDSNRMRAAYLTYGPNINPGSGWARSIVGQSEIFFHANDGGPNRQHRFFLGGNVSQFAGQSGRDETNWIAYETYLSVWTVVAQWTPKARVWEEENATVMGYVDLAPSWVRTLYHLQETGDMTTDGTCPQTVAAEETLYGV